MDKIQTSYSNADRIGLRRKKQKLSLQLSETINLHEAISMQVNNLAAEYEKACIESSICEIALCVPPSVAVRFLGIE